MAYKIDKFSHFLSFSMVFEQMSELKYHRPCSDDFGPRVISSKSTGSDPCYTKNNMQNVNLRMSHHLVNWCRCSRQRFSRWSTGWLLRRRFHHPLRCPDALDHIHEQRNKSPSSTLFEHYFEHVWSVQCSICSFRDHLIQQFKACKSHSQV